MALATGMIGKIIAVKACQIKDNPYLCTLKAIFIYQKSKKLCI